MAFPFKPEDGKMGGEQEDVWTLASLSLPFCLNCREAPDSKNWFYEKSIKLFRRTDEPEFGYAHGNVDGYWYLNNDYHLRSVYLGKFDRPTRLQNLRLAGPKGSITLAALDEIPERLKLSEHRGEEQVELTGADRAVAMSIVKDGQRRRSCNRQPGTASGVARRAGLEVRPTTVHPSPYDYRGSRGDVFERVHPAALPSAALQPRRYSGARIVARRKLRRRFVWPVHLSKLLWRAQRLDAADGVDEEGYLVVRDEYLPGPDVEGFRRRPTGCPNEGDSEDAERHWYGPRDGHAVADLRKRVLLYMHPDRRLEFGQCHRASQDLGYAGLRSCSAGPFCAKAKSRFGWQCCGRSTTACIPERWRH